MRQRNRIVSLAAPVAALLLAPAVPGSPVAAAQGEPGTGLGPIQISGRERGLAEVDGELWAVGATYKARFDRGGVLIVPPLGSQAPRSLPLGLALESIALGGRELLAADGLAAPRHGAFEVRYEHGGLVTERYEVRTEALEQTFTLHELPNDGGERGELVVRLAVDTELAGRADGAGLFFEGAPGRGLHYGALTAIDARGERAAGDVRLTAGAIELVVPADFLATAEAPLLLDPTIGGSFDVSPGSGDHRDPDVTRIEDFGGYAAVYERHWSATDIDVYGQGFDEIGGLVGSTILFEPSIAQVAQDPAAAAAGAVGSQVSLVVVWEQGSTPTGTQSIVGRHFSATDGLSASLTISSGPGSHTNPDSAALIQTMPGGSTDGVHLVVWQNDGIRAQRLSLPGLLTSFGLLDSQLVLSSGLIDTNPSVSVAFEFADVALVVWERFFATPAPGDHDLYAALVNMASSVPIEFAQSILTTIGPDETRPRATGVQQSPGDFPAWVTYTRRASSTGGSRDIYMLPLQHQEPPGLAPLTPVPVEAIAGEDDHDAGFSMTKDFDATGGFGKPQLLNVAWVHEGGGAFGNVVNGAQFNASCLFGCSTEWILCEPEYPVAGAPTGLVFSNVEVFDDMCVFESVGLGVFAQELGHQHFHDSEHIGGGCFFPSGEAALECGATLNSNLAHVLVAGPPLAPVFLILGFERIDVSCEECMLIPDPFTGFVIPSFTDAIGRAKVPMPIPNQPSLVGIEFFDQWAAAPGGNPCAPLGITLSSALKAEIKSF